MHNTLNIGSGLMSVCYQTMRCIIGRNADLHPVSYHNPDTMFFHPSGQNTPYRHVVITFNFHGPTTKDLYNFTFQLDQIVSTQKTLLSGITVVLYCLKLIAL